MKFREASDWIWGITPTMLAWVIATQAWCTASKSMAIMDIPPTEITLSCPSVEWNEVKIPCNSTWRDKLWEYVKWTPAEIQKTFNFMCKSGSNIGAQPTEKCDKKVGNTKIKKSAEDGAVVVSNKTVNWSYVSQWTTPADQGGCFTDRETGEKKYIEKWNTIQKPGSVTWDYQDGPCPTK